MHQSLRTLPDTSLASALTAAYGRTVTVESDHGGRWAALRLASGRSLVLALSGGPGARQLVTRVGAAGPALTDLDGLADLRLDLEVLAAAGEACELFVRGQLRADDFEWAAACATGDDEEEVAELALQRARALDHDLGAGDVPSPGACFVELALALHRLAQIAVDNAPEFVDASAEEVVCENR